MTDDIIAQIEDMIDVLESMPNTLWAELENNPENIEAYYASVSKLHRVSISAMFSFAEIKAVRVAKFGSVEEQQDLLQQMGVQMSEAELQQFLEQSRTTSVAEIRQLIARER